VTSVPVITIDGPVGVGKGTLSQRLAGELGWHYLNSGALYRLLALAALKQKISLDDEGALVVLTRDLDVSFSVKTASQEGKVFLGREDVTQAICEETVGEAASRLAVLPRVRTALLQCQRDFRASPGLVAEGRDMGTVVFPDAVLKIYLTASAAARTERRYQQLLKMGVDVKLATLTQEIVLRDARDETRKTAPLKAASDAKVVDTTSLTEEEAFACVLKLVHQVI
jgi:cytidylate kinase